ncbi:MAG TPA: universal stress protein [Rickettsiales bacterium]|nr:universal stress protein [Rickettsiales bacterium]
MEENKIEQRNQIPTILVCIDTTNASVITLRYACWKAKKLGFAVQILSVLEGSHKNLLFGAHIIGREKRQQLEKYMQKLISDVHKETHVMPIVSIREGDIANEIIREVKTIPNCIMVVFGKSRNSKSDNTVLPKMAQKIGTKIRIPILIVPENLDNNLFGLMV